MGLDMTCPNPFLNFLLIEWLTLDEEERKNNKTVRVRNLGGFEPSIPHLIHAPKNARDPALRH